MLRLGPDFRKIAIGNAASNLSDGIAFICMPLLAASISDDPLAVSGLSVAYAIPRIISVLGIGVLIDRVDRRPLLYLSNFSRAVMFGVVTLLVFLGVADLWVLYVSYAVIGVIETLADSSVFAVLPKAVPSKALLDHANSRIAGTQVVIDEFVGPPLGGFLFGLAAFAPTAVNAAVLLVAGVSYVMLRGDYRSTIVVSERPSVVADLREGAAWTARHPIVRTLVIVGCIVSVGYMIPFSYLVLYASKVLGLDATGYGLLLSFSAVGGLAGSWVAGRVRRRLGYGWSIVGALLLGAAAFVVIALTDNVIVVAIALAAYICHSVVWGVLASSVRQRITPDEIMGRVGSMSRLLGLLGLGLGAFLGGVLASVLGLRVPFVVAAGLFVIAAALCVTLVPRLRAWERAQAESVEGVVEAAEER